MPNVAARDLHALVKDILVAAGASETNADRMGEALVASNLAGVDTHGVFHLHRYVTEIRFKDDKLPSDVFHENLFVCSPCARTGAESGLVVIDVDVKGKVDGCLSASKLSLGDTLVSRTPSGGSTTTIDTRVMLSAVGLDTDQGST